MNLIYKEYIKFLRDVTGKELADIKEGYFWLDKQIIKGFDNKDKAKRCIKHEFKIAWKKCK